MENDLLKFNAEKKLNKSNLDKKNKRNKIKHYLSSQKRFLMNNSALYYSITSALHQNNLSKNFLVDLAFVPLI